MISVAIDTTVLSTAHQGRGVGSYTRGLLAALAHHQADLTVTPLNSPQADSANLIHYPAFDLFFPTLPFSSPRPFIVTIHDVIPLRYPAQFPPGLKGKLNFFRQRLSLRRASAIITDSKASRFDLISHLHLSPDTIHVIYLAADPSFQPANSQQINSFKTRQHLPPKFVGYVGDINYNKNLPRLIQAIGQLQIPLIIATRAKLDTSVTETQTRHVVTAINSALKSLKQPDLVRFIDLPDTRSLNLFYNSMTWYIQPSLSEGFGLPLLEAMSTGTPVICSQTSSLPEIASSAAIYFDPHSTDSIAHSLNQAISLSPVQRRRYSNLVLKRSKHFSWAKTARDTLKVYQQVLTTK